jgi:hypothetical protein
MSSYPAIRLVILPTRWHRARRTSESSNIGKSYPVGAANMFSNSPDATGGRTLYIKEVDANENTTRFVQEIYDATGLLVAVHEKFPVDSGHKQL